MELLKQIDLKLMRLEARSDELFHEVSDMYKTAYHEGLEYDEVKKEWVLKEMSSNP